MNSAPTFRDSLADLQSVLAACASLTGIDRSDAKCDRAFAFLQDESINPKLEQDDAFYQVQRSIAVHCSRSTDR